LGSRYTRAEATREAESDGPRTGQEIRIHAERKPTSWLTGYNSKRCGHEEGTSRSFMYAMAARRRFVGSHQMTRPERHQRGVWRRVWLVRFLASMAAGPEHTGGVRTRIPHSPRRQEADRDGARSPNRRTRLDRARIGPHSPWNTAGSRYEKDLNASRASATSSGTRCGSRNIARRPRPRACAIFQGVVLVRPGCKRRVRAIDRGESPWARATVVSAGNDCLCAGGRLMRHWARWSVVD